MGTFNDEIISINKQHTLFEKASICEKAPITIVPHKYAFCATNVFRTDG